MDDAWFTDMADELARCLLDAEAARKPARSCSRRCSKSGDAELQQGVVDAVIAPAAVARVLVELIDQPPRLVLAACRLYCESAVTTAVPCSSRRSAERVDVRRRCSKCFVPRSTRCVAPARSGVLICLQPRPLPRAKCRTRSARPYSIASSGPRKRSRSMSRITSSTSRCACLRDDLRVAARDREDLLRRDLDVGRRAAEAARALVDHHLRVREHEPLAGGAAGEDQRARRHRHPDRVGLHVRLHELHRVVDREAGIRVAARRVHVEADVGVRILRLEKEQLRDDQVRRGVRDLRAEEHDPLAEQARVDVERALEAPIRLDHHRHELIHYDPQLIGCIFIRNQWVARQVRGAERWRSSATSSFPASPAEVWEALTEPERLEEWFANEVSLDARPGGEGVFRWGDGDERRATVREVEPEERLVLDWEDDGQVVLELEEVDGGTRLHVVETAPEWSTALELHALAWAPVA